MDDYVPLRLNRDELPEMMRRLVGREIRVMGYSVSDGAVGTYFGKLNPFISGGNYILSGVNGETTSVCSVGSICIGVREKDIFNAELLPRFQNG